MKTDVLDTSSRCTCAFLSCAKDTFQCQIGSNGNRKFNTGLSFLLGMDCYGPVVCGLANQRRVSEVQQIFESLRGCSTARVFHSNSFVPSSLPISSSEDMYC